eukprot:352895-Chlamydomonas_euryale.AAC.2
MFVSSRVSDAAKASSSPRLGGSARLYSAPVDGIDRQQTPTPEEQEQLVFGVEGGCKRRRRGVGHAVRGSD